MHKLSCQTLCPRFSLRAAGSWHRFNWADGASATLTSAKALSVGMPAPQSSLDWGADCNSGRILGEEGLSENRGGPQAICLWTSAGGCSETALSTISVSRPSPTAYSRSTQSYGEDLVQIASPGQNTSRAAPRRSAEARSK